MRHAYPHLLGWLGYLPSYFPNKNSLDNNNYYYCYETKISDLFVIIICDKKLASLHVAVLLYCDSYEAAIECEIGLAYKPCAVFAIPLSSVLA